MCHSKGAVVGAALGGGLLLNILGLLGALGFLHHTEKKERRALAAAVSSSTDSLELEEKTIVIDNRGPQGGPAGVAEIVTSGPSGTQTTTVPTMSGGAAIVSTTAAGIPGGTVKVEPGQTMIVKAEHPVGRPEDAKIVSTTPAP